MRVRLFGDSNDDKGTQLERLTKRLLEKLGYKQVTLNPVGSGGSEIDVRAEFSIPGLAHDNVVHLIGECKAHQTPIALPDWLKFLGKVFTERTCRKKETRGIYVALSGVNGNVAGAFDDLRAHDPTIELISGDRLAKLISEEFKLPELQIVYGIVGQLTTDAFVEASIGYYGGLAFG